MIYTGLHQVPEQVVQAALQEDADAVGLSLLSGAHLTLVPRVVEGLREQGLEDVLLIVGGIIPEADIPKLEGMGVAEVFTPGVSLPTIIEHLTEALERREEASGHRGLSASGGERGNERNRPVDLFEYQGKQYFARFGIPTPAGVLCRTVDEARVGADELGYPVVGEGPGEGGGPWQGRRRPACT